MLPYHEPIIECKEDSLCLKNAEHKLSYNISLGYPCATIYRGWSENVGSGIKRLVCFRFNYDKGRSIIFGVTS